MQLSTTDPLDMSLNGYMVASREDTGALLDGSVAYIGSWENGTKVKLLCNGVSTLECIICSIMWCSSIGYNEQVKKV